MALTNNKVLDLVKKLFAQADSEAKLGNEGAAISFAEKARDLLKTYHLENPVGIVEEVIGKTIILYPYHRQNARTRDRVIWFEELAKVVAEANFCSTEIELQFEFSYYATGRKPIESKIFIVGTDLDREVAIFIFNKLSELAYNSCKFQMNLAKKNVGQVTVDFRSQAKVESLKEWPGDEVFIENFHKGFREAILTSFREKKAINGNSSYEDITVEAQHNYSWTPKELIQNIGRKLGTKIHTKVDKPIDELREEIVSNHIGDIFFLLDNSASMSEFAKMPQAQKGAINYAEKVIEQNYRIGLIGFDSSANFKLDLVANLNKFKNEVNKFDAGGYSTYLSDAIQQAMFRFTNFRVRRVICIVTDGICHDSQKALEQADIAKKAGIEIMTIGTEDADLEFLRNLSSKPKLALAAKSHELESGIREMVGLLRA